jgi:putative oxidoreductase
MPAMKQLAPFADRAYAALRVMSGFMLMFHGLQKIFGLWSPRPSPSVGSQLWIGGLLELVGGTLIMIGFQTRLAAFVCSGMMAVAYFQYHWKFQFSSAFFPGVNGGDAAVLYCFLFLFVACRGGVKWCVDKVSD